MDITIHYLQESASSTHAMMKKNLYIRSSSQSILSAKTFQLFKSINKSVCPASYFGEGKLLCQTQFVWDKVT